MRIIPFFISAILTTGLIIALNSQLSIGNSKTPRLGYFLSPQYGFWQNAEPANVSFNDDIKMPGISQQVDVYFDDRLVPHIYAENDADAYFIQGYIHAKFRLWQMEFQTNVVSGRLSEILGEERINTDKYFRRLGLVYAAENSVKAMEANPETKAAADAYTAGVNTYINSLEPQQIPFEYKLLDYKPEAWTNLKSALFLKLMSWDLSGAPEDLTYTNTKAYFGYEDFLQLFPLKQDSLDPIIPKGTVFEKPEITVTKPTTLDSLYLGKNNIISNQPPLKPNKNNGSNNWAVAGSKTKSGKPILCNDPHLGLNLPSLWFEMQITTPEYSTYGTTFPGAPTIIIGFNDSCAWGVTNAGRDVKDYYAMQFKDSTMQEYWFDGKWQPANIRTEIIKVKGKPSIEEKIAMTIFGPVMYDKSYLSDSAKPENIAVRWKAHDGSNELRTFYKLNRMKGYVDYVDAISTFECPGQNFVFAAHNGDIAIRQQGAFIAKWEQQGDFVMPGTDSSYMWQSVIPAKENPQMLNPERGFVSSANQQAVDATYPYYLGKPNLFPPYRGLIINRKLAAMNNITPQDMQMLQTDNYNVFAEICKPSLLKYINKSALNETEKKYLQTFINWNLRNDIHEQGATIFKIWWDSLETAVWADEYAKASVKLSFPEPSTLIEKIINDSSTYKFIDNINTPNKETLEDVITLALKNATKELEMLEQKEMLEWAKYKDTKVQHLTKLPALSTLHIPIGGGKHIINATTSVHGPSWRMIVHLTDKIEAYGVYPGGQSGNPGSKYYNNFINQWAEGKYYDLIFIKKQEARKDSRMKWHTVFING
ncbi:MAG: penicillin acylase family protein [Chitinophagaceae bacterium]|nr:penicillin acylase family protein [Chitinophagaceae bacterium]MCW5905188.1 penicillin acylase family protein [Chitinophagaceae bacterium]